MSNFIISYDLIKTKDYTKLIEEIKKYPNWCKPLLSVWVISSSQSPSEIRDNLRRYMDSDDKLLVLKLATVGEGAWSNLPDDVAKWLVANL